MPDGMQQHKLLAGILGVGVIVGDGTWGSMPQAPKEVSEVVRNIYTIQTYIGL